ncbi:MAG TPA: ATP-binding cassette domain-containing protein, partial [Rhodocyclaceae bacterium]|nr:ATP-binding cassette domain-containing protein [Rhodocyclaceae bacterium]
MPLISVSGACLAFGHVPLLDKADFQLDPKERVALIGRNGTGKSSLLKAIAGQAALDDGKVWVAPSSRVAYVAQEPVLDPAHTVFEAVVAGMGESARLVAAYHAVAHRLAHPAEDEDFEVLLNDLHELQMKLEALGAWQLASDAERVIEQFGLDPDAIVGTLSGGQKKRLSLAAALAISPDVLLLDEPTNHLDIAAIRWLEDLLIDASNQRGVAMVFITHDRRFLDRVATRIVELDRGDLASFPGNFSTYQLRKEEMLRDESLANARFDKLLKEEEVWIRKGVEARRTRAMYRVQRLDELRLQRAARREQQGKANLRLETGDKSGQLVAELENVSKSFGDKTVIRDFSCRILRGDRVGVIGPNGAGKTTLLKLILGELEPDSGTVRRGTKQQIAYFDQFREVLDPEAALSDVISPGSDFVEIGGQKQHVIGYLGDFLFAPQRARSPVKSLSGGERNRLLLARLFARPANVLVLDEPTNDLDIETLELLEQLLDQYPGTIFLVSHDRAFLDNVVTQVIAYDNSDANGLSGQWVENVGGFDDWERVRSERAARATATAQADARSQKNAANAAGKSNPPANEATAVKSKLSFKDQRELEALPGQIAALESEQAGL